MIDDKINFLLEVQQIAVGYDQFEPLMNDLLDRILRHEECHDSVRQRFELMLDVIDVDRTVVLEFCMHTLRWPAIRDKAEELMTRTDQTNARQWYARVLESFHDDWPDRELWERYESKQ